MTGKDMGVHLIAAERRRQVQVKKRTDDHDDQHNRGELAVQAARCAVAHTDAIIVHPDDRGPGEWPFEEGNPFPYWHPVDMYPPIHRLVVAGALIAAEIDRLLRKGVSDEDQ